MNKIQIVVTGLLAWSGILFAQSFDAGQFAAAQKTNSQALQKYTWEQRLELQVKGETKKLILNLMRYDAEGKHQKTQLSEEPQAQPQQQQQAPARRGGRIKAKVIENKKEEFKEMMEGLAQVVQSYTTISPETMKAAIGQAEKFAGEGDLQGTAGIRLNGILQKGDMLTVWVAPASLLFRRIEVSSFYEQKPVTVTADYSNIPDGPNYMAGATLTYPAKALSLKVENFNYKQN